MSQTLFFTGHRPKAWKDDYEGWVWAFNTLQDAVGRSIKNGFDTFVTGLALGWDTAAFNACYFHKKVRNKNITIIGAIPYPSQHKLWDQADIDRYREMINLCDKVEVISPDPYHVSKMHIRNKWMADRSNACIAGFVGGMKPPHTWPNRGGTVSTVKYTMSKKIPVFIIDSSKRQSKWV